MAERTQSDRSDRDRAPEEAAIELWVEEAGDYLTIPGSGLGARSMRQRRGDAMSFKTPALPN